MSESDYLLFYSNKCLHSKDFLTILSKDVQLNQKFTKINIDNKNIKLPPYIKAVPTAIITNNGSPKLYVGSEIFKWYKESRSVATQQNNSNAILDWDPMGMAGYSDAFSYIDDKPEAQKKSFAYLEENNAIYTPDDKTYTGNDSEKNGKKSEMESNFEKVMNQRKHDVPNAPPRL